MMKRLFDIPISSLSPLPLFGIIKRVYVPENIYEFISLLTYFDKEKIEYVVFGKGTNILFTSSVIFTPVILYKENILSFNDNQIIVSGNMSSLYLGNVLFKNGYSNLLGAETIPGSIGAGIKNNATYYGQNYLNGLTHLYIYNNGMTYFKDINEFSFAYRKSNIQGIILFAFYKPIKSKVGDEELRKVYFSLRKKQKCGPSLGSVFLNPKEDSAYKYILGVKKELGFDDVCFSPIHANFFSFMKKTNPERVMMLINKTKDLVYKKYGVNLELEIKLIK